MSTKKKIIVMSSLVLLLAVTAVFNFIFANSATTTSLNQGVTTANYFETYRSERTTTRNEEIIQLDSVIALYEEGDERYEEATEMKMEIVATMEKELVLENMVKSLGFSDAVVSVSIDSDNINIFINHINFFFELSDIMLNHIHTSVCLAQHFIHLSDLNHHIFICIRRSSSKLSLQNFHIFFQFINLSLHRSI